MKTLLRRLAAVTLILCLLPTSAAALSVTDAKSLLELHHIDDLPPQAESAQTLEELLTVLGDPHTVYMTQEEYAQFLASMNDATLVGIGVSIQEHELGVLIVSVLKDSPAFEAGLASGDIITAIENIPITGSDQARSLLTGEVDTTVTVRVQKADGSVQDLTLTRKVITIATTVQYGLSEDGNACVILCTSFGDGTASHIGDALTEHDDQVNGYIIDLSKNPGGTSVSGAFSASRFIGGATMYYLRNGQDQYNYTSTLSSAKPLTQKPAIALTGPYSASSAELFLGAIRDHHAGIAIGQRTRGKGVAQVIFDQSNAPHLFDGDALKVTTYRFFSPAGTTNDKIGVMPTLLMSLENTYQAALLLCADSPEDPAGHLKLMLNEHIFYINLETAMSQDYRAAFAELLSALPLKTQLRWDNGNGKYTDVSPQTVAQTLGLSEFVPRTFSDVEGSPYADAINTLAIYKLLGGYGDGTFRPDASITRAEFCAMLGNVLAMNAAPIAQSRFSDVDAGAWYAPIVHAMQDGGLLGGYGDGTFRPDNVITQEEAVSILSKLSTQLNMYAYNRRNLTPSEETMAPFAPFSDWAQHAAWLLDSCNVDISTLTAPQNSTSRGLAADLICQLLTKTNVLWP